MNRTDVHGEAGSLPFQRRIPGLGSYLAAAFAALCALLVAVLVGLGEPAATDELNKTIGMNLAGLAVQGKDRLDEALFERYREVGLLARRIAAEGDLAGAQAELDQIQASYPDYAWIGVAGLDGVVRAATRGILAGQDVGKRPWFVAGLAAGHLTDMHEALMLGKALGKAGAEPPRFFDVSFPIVRGGKVIGVLGAHLYSTWTHQLRTALNRSRDAGSGPEPLMVSSSGVVLMGPTGLEGKRLQLASVAHAKPGASGYEVEVWPDGKSYLVGYSTSQPFRDSPGLGWTVMVRQELATAQAPVRRLQQSLLLGGAALALVFAALGWGIARRITRPLLELAQDAKALQRDGSRLARRNASYREIGTLRQTLDALLGALGDKESALREANASLETKVEARTLELQGLLSQVRSSERRLHTIIESSPDAFVGVDAQGRVAEWNSQAETLFGMTRQQAFGMEVGEALCGGGGGAHLFGRMRMDALAASSTSHTIQETLRTRDGLHFPAEFRCAIVQSADLWLLTAFVQDITARKEVEALKDQFTSIVTHELRTPTASVSASLALLQKLSGALPRPAVQLIDNAAQGARRLSRLITDVLWLEKAAAGGLALRMRVQPVAPVVAQAVHELTPYADAMGIRLAWEGVAGVQAVIDEDRIVQVCTNLVSNAVKFSPRGSEVRITLSQEGQEARLAVDDDGPGIPPEFQHRIFGRFAQAPGAGQADRGSGLGLNITQAIVHAHGGRIGFDTEPGVGTEFFVLLPLAQPEPAAPAGPTILQETNT